MDTVSLSEHLRTATAQAHRDAERSPFVQLFTSGRLDRATHAAHLRALHDLYAALEEGLEAFRDDPRLGAFHLPELWRQTSLEADLAYLLGPAWRAHDPVPSARAYAARLRALPAAAAHRLVAHAYVRYLGDLSGGLVLRRLAAAQLGLDGDGLRFYEFPSVPDPAAYKREFRRRLDAFPLAAGEAADLVDEARVAFALNAAIFAELVTGRPGAAAADEEAP